MFRAADRSGTPADFATWRKYTMFLRSDDAGCTSASCAILRRPQNLRGGGEHTLRRSVSRASRRIFLGPCRVPKCEGDGTVTPKTETKLNFSTNDIRRQTHLSTATHTGTHSHGNPFLSLVRRFHEHFSPSSPTHRFEARSNRWKATQNPNRCSPASSKS